MIEINDGRDLVTAFQEGAVLSREVAARHAAERGATDWCQELLEPLEDIEQLLRDPEAARAAGLAGLALKTHNLAEATLADLEHHVGAQVLRQKVVIENISQNEKPVRIYGRDGRPIKRRHRAVGRIIGLDLSQNVLIMKPHVLTPRGIVRDYWEVDMLDDHGKPLVDIAFVEEPRSLRRSLPALSRQVARIPE